MRARRAQLVVEVITRSPLDSPDDGRDLFRIIERTAPILMPGKAGVDEPPRRRFNWDALEREWGDMLYVWTGREVRGVEGLVFRDLRPAATQMPSISINAPVEVVRRLHLPGLLRALSLRFDTWFGYAHVMTTDDRATYPAGDPGALPGDPHDLIITEEQVRRALPPPTWATVYGGELLERIGVDTFAGAPAAVADVWDGRIGYLQLTDDPLDTLEAHDELQAARRAAQEHVGSHSFEAPAKEAGDPLQESAPEQADGMLARAFALAADMARAGEAPAQFGCFLREDGGIEFVNASEDMPASDREEAVMHLLRAAAARPDVVCAGVVVLTRREARVTLEQRNGERMRVVRPYRLRSGAVEWSEPCTSDADIRLFSRAPWPSPWG